MIIEKAESLEEFYKKKFNYLPQNLKQDIGHFNVFSIEDTVGPHGTPAKYSRREFYKITLMRGDNVCHYADKSIEVSGTTLMFFNPNVPYAWDCSVDGVTGFFTIFTDGFFSGKIRGSILDFPMFAPGGKPAYPLTPEQDQQVSTIYNKMKEELNSDYVYKYDLLRNYVTELIHFALKIQPAEALYQHPNAKARITAVFTELLERQFPIESPHQRFTLRSANDFAKQLAVHVNHLNRAIKETTGKTTSEHIFERLVAEAKALLKHTNWNVSEISYCLGFEEPAHFNNFFKKQVALTPTAYRNH
jgi:AraC-like DNA-binding protein